MGPDTLIFAKRRDLTKVPTVVLLAKAPFTHAKTRLSSALSAEQRAALVMAMLQDTLLLVEQAAEARSCLHTPGEKIALHLMVAAAPDPMHPDFEPLQKWWEERTPLSSPLAMTFCYQGTGSLGERLADNLRRLERAPQTPVLFLGSDSPSLPAELLLQALSALEQAEVVLAPSFDGGYVLLGLKQMEPAALENIPWSTPEVLEQTVRQLRAANRRVTLLPLWYDIDEPEDLPRLHRHLRTLHLLGETSRAPHTLHLLNTHLG